MVNLFILLFFFSLPLFSQLENENINKESQNNFFVKCLTFSNEDTIKTRVDVYIQVPYSSIQFVVDGNSYLAHYEVAINFLTSDGNSVLERLWNEEIRVSQFQATQSKYAYQLSQRTLPIAPGNYIVRVQIRDKESKQQSTNIQSLIIPSYSSINFGMSDIMLVNRITEKNNVRSIVPNVSSIFTKQNEKTFIFFELYNVLQNDSVEITYTIKNEKREQLYNLKKTYRSEGKKTQILEMVDTTQYSLGKYLLEVAAKNLTKNISFAVGWEVVPFNFNDLELAIKQLEYIAPEKEYDAMEDAETQSEKEKLFRAFWKKRDPSPDTDYNEFMEEYYRRVNYANKNFSHYSQGWRTDRGMVYIVLGSPSNIERHPFDIDSKPYEIWSYYDFSRDVVFIDETGFGDYRLASSIWDLLQRYKK